MKEFSYGHVWWDTPKIDVALRSVSELWLGRLEPGAPILHDAWILDYVYTAGLKGSVGEGAGRWVEFGARTARLIPPRRPYRHDTTHLATPVHAAWLAFHGGEDLGLNRFFERRQGWAVFHDPGERLGRHLHAMAEFASRHGGDGYWQSQADLFTVIHMLSTSVAGNDGGREITAPADGHGFDPLVATVRSYLSRRLAEPVTRRDVAAYMNMSVSSLAHRYSRLAGEGVQETLHRLRFELARELLLKGESVKLVAERTGFGSIYHFSKAFKKTMKIPPSEFAKRANQYL